LDHLSSALLINPGWPSGERSESMQPHVLPGL
jgi:hypothetical protein